jgi:hypothetical protein
MSIASPASFRLCSRAERSVGSWKTLSVGSCQNQRIDQPCAALRERPSLNAKRIASSTGASDQRM